MIQIEIGKTQNLTILRSTDFGIYLGVPGSEESVLLPKKQIPENKKIGDEISVFVYRDSEDRMIATTNKPLVRVYEFGYLKVKSVTKVGAFLDFGLERDLFLPFKEQEGRVRENDQVLVYVYLDKSKRLSCTMRVYDYLSSVVEREFRVGEPIQGYVYRIEPKIGAFVAVKEKKTDAVYGMERLYFGLIPASQLYRNYRVGDQISGRVVRIRPDGKIDLSDQKRGVEKLTSDGEKVLEVIREFDGVLPFSDNAPPEMIKREFQMSKAAFKRAIGHLKKEGKVEILPDSVKLL